MIVIAQRQIKGDYGLAVPGDRIDLEDKLGQHLIECGLVVPEVPSGNNATENKTTMPPEQPVRRRSKKETK